LHAGGTKDLDTSDSDVDLETRVTGVCGHEYAQNTCGKQYNHSVPIIYIEFTLVCLF